MKNYFLFMKKIYELSIKLHKFCLVIPELEFIYLKRRDGYVFTAGLRDFNYDEEEDSIIIQGLIPFKYYIEMSQKIKNEQPESWIDIEEEDFEEEE